MPAYDLSPEQLQDLAAFLKSLDFTHGIKPVKKPVEEILNAKPGMGAKAAAGS